MAEQNKKDDLILKVHPGAYWEYYGLVALLVLGAFFVSFKYLIIAVISFGIVEFFRRAETIHISNENIVREFRFLTTGRTIVDYSKIQDITINQGIIDRIIGIGNLKINTAGSPGIEIIFSGVKNPRKIEELIRQKMSAVVKR